MTEVQFAKQFLTTLDSKPTKYQSDHVFDPKTFQLRIPYTLPKLSHPPHPLPPKSTPTTAPAPGSEPISKGQAQPSTIDLTLKSTRNPTFTLHLPSLPASTPIATLKSQVQSLLSGSVPAEKIKILYNKKPIPPSKSTIHDVLAGDGSSEIGPDAELGVMVMGGAPDPSPNVQTVNLSNEVGGPGGINLVDTAKSVQPSLTSPVDAEGVSQKLERQKSPPVQPGEPSGTQVLSTTEFWDDLQGFLEQRLRDTDEAKSLRALFEKAVAGR